MWQVVRKSVVGQGHVKAGLVCQDYSGEAGSGTRRFIALADGAGSAKYAERGAQIAVDVVLKEFERFSGALAEVDAGVASAWLEAVRVAIGEEAMSIGAGVGDFATTLLFALFDGREGYFWQLGDGAWIVKVEGVLQVATWPHTGHYVNETVFVTSDAAHDKWVHAYFPSVVAAVGFTDGLERIFLDFTSHGPHMPIMDKIFGYLQANPLPSDVGVQINHLLDSPIVCERSDDDKTVALAWWPHGDANG
jgi:serine/threonine protein phosphatase PrpC